MTCRNVSQCLLWLGSILVFIAGLVLAAISILVYFGPDIKVVFDILDPPKLYILVWGSAGIGILTVFVAICGCYGVGHDNNCCMTLFFVIILAVSAATVGLGAYMMSQATQIDTQLKELLDLTKLNITDSYASPLLEYQQKYKCCGIDAQNSEDWQQSKYRYPCFSWADRFPFGCGCNPNDYTADPNRDNPDWENPCWLMNPSQLQSLWGCRQDQTYPVGRDDGNFQGLWQIGCRAQINADYDKFTEFYSITALVVGVVFFIVCILTLCVCCCPKHQDESRGRRTGPTNQRSTVSNSRSVAALSERTGVRSQAPTRPVTRQNSNVSGTSRLTNKVIPVV